MQCNCIYGKALIIAGQMQRETSSKLSKLSPLLTALCLVAGVQSACSGIDSTESRSNLRVLLQAEDVITSGIRAGNSSAEIQDGWDVTFEKYIIALGDIDLHLATDSEMEMEAPTIFAVDLTQVDGSGLELWTLDNLPEGRWEFGYSSLIENAQRHESVSVQDFKTLIDGSLNYLIEGQLSQSSGLSCPPKALANVPKNAQVLQINSSGDDCFLNENINFHLAVSAEANYGPCEIDGLSGVATVNDSVTSAAITIHGDHLFFNGFPEGGESGVLRLAQWMADCDLNLDGTVTELELKAVAPRDLGEVDDRFQLGGSPITPLSDMLTYLRAQLQTQGHFQGEGECPLNGKHPQHEH